MTWTIAARLFARPTRAPSPRIPEALPAPRRRPIHSVRCPDRDTVVERVLALRVLLHQHCQGETPFEAVDLETLCRALEVFVQRYELAPAAALATPVVVSEAAPVEEPVNLVVGPPEAATPAKTPTRSAPAPPATPRIEVVVAAPGRATLRAVEAAERFVEWVRLSNKCGTYTSAEFSELYRAHCDAEDLIVLTDNILRPALRRIPGVTQLKSDTGRKRQDRVRRSLWRIDADPAATVDVPWDELPQRVVA